MGVQLTRHAPTSVPSTSSCAVECAVMVSSDKAFFTQPLATWSVPGGKLYAAYDPAGIPPREIALVVQAALQATTADEAFEGGAGLISAYIRATRQNSAVRLPRA